jgi:hypothetical protein
MPFLMIPYLAALALLLIELGGGLPRRAPRTPLLPAWLWLAALVATYAAQLAAVRYGATHLLTPSAWREAMPIPVLFIDARHVDALSAVYLFCGALQSYALLALYRARPSRAFVAGGAAALLAMSFAAPAFASFDPYGYVHNALLGLQAYSPPATPFQGEYRVIDLWFGKPTATLYGPLWLAIVRLVTGAMPTLLAKLLALRAFNLVLYVVLLLLLRALGLPRRIVVAAALNPALMMQFVANAHNDVIAVDLIAGAAILARRYPAAAVGTIAIAGLVKLPYVLLGLPVLAAVRSKGLRYAGCAAAIGVALAGSWLGGGAAYARALTNHGFASHVQNEWHLVPVLIAVAAIVVAVAGGRRLIGALWMIPSIGAFGSPILFPWYLTWSFPYALARRRIAGFLLVAFPFVSALVMPEFLRVWTLFFVFPLAVALSASGWFGARAVEVPRRNAS